MYHLAEYHADWGSDDPTLPKIPGQLLVDSFITSEEEGLMGIDETLTEDWREENEIPDTDGIEEMREDLKRARAASSVSVGGRARKSQRR
jgi:hypothetical protein